MTSENTVSRRKVVLTGISVGLASLVGGIAFKHLRAAGGPRRELPGDALVLPAEKTIGNRMVSLLQLSPDGKQMGAVFGNLGRKSVYVTKFPPERPADYKLIAELDNCYKLDGLSWNHTDPTQLSCKVTEVNSKQKLPDITTEQQWQKLFRNKMIEEKDLAAYLYVLTTQGNSPSRICPLVGSRSDGNSASTAWPMDGIVFCSERSNITRCTIESKSTNVIYNAAASAAAIGDGTMKGIQALAWKPDQRELIALECVRKGGSLTLATIYFDLEGKAIRADVPVPSATKAEELSFFNMDAKGESFVAIRGPAFQNPKVLWGQLDSEKRNEVALPSGEMCVPACVNATGVAVLIFSNQESQRANFKAKKPAQMKVPLLKDYSFRVVSLA